MACVWPRVLWLNPDNEAPGFQTAQEAKKAAQKGADEAKKAAKKAMGSIKKMF